MAARGGKGRRRQLSAAAPRRQVRVSLGPEQWRRLDSAAEELGVSVSLLAGTAITFGLDDAAKVVRKGGSR